jgi:hypothetical protein
LKKQKDIPKNQARRVGDREPLVTNPSNAEIDEIEKNNQLLEKLSCLGIDYVIPLKSITLADPAIIAKIEVDEGYVIKTDVSASTPHMSMAKDFYYVSE